MVLLVLSFLSHGTALQSPDQCSHHRGYASFVAQLPKLLVEGVDAYQKDLEVLPKMGEQAQVALEEAHQNMRLPTQGGGCATGAVVGAALTAPAPMVGGGVGCIVGSLAGSVALLLHKDTLRHPSADLGSQDLLNLDAQGYPEGLALGRHSKLNLYVIQNQMRAQRGAQERVRRELKSLEVPAFAEEPSGRARRLDRRADLQRELGALGRARVVYLRALDRWLSMACESKTKPSPRHLASTRGKSVSISLPQGAGRTARPGL